MELEIAKSNNDIVHFARQKYILLSFEDSEQFEDACQYIMLHVMLMKLLILLSTDSAISCSA
jgi:hypothetical protein